MSSLPEWMQEASPEHMPVFAAVCALRIEGTRRDTAGLWCAGDRTDRAGPPTSGLHPPRRAWARTAGEGRGACRPPQGRALERAGPHAARARSVRPGRGGYGPWAPTEPGAAGRRDREHVHKGASRGLLLAGTKGCSAATRQQILASRRSPSHWRGRRGVSLSFHLRALAHQRRRYGTGRCGAG